MRRETRKMKYSKAFFAALISMLLIVGLSPTIAFAAPESVTDGEKKLEQLNNQLQSWSQKLGEASDKYYTALDEHSAAAQKVQDNKKKIEATKKLIDKNKAKLSVRAANMYRSGPTSFIDVLLGATNFEDFASTWGFLNDINEENAALISENKSLKTQLENAQVELDKNEKLAKEKFDEAETVKASAESMVADYSAKVESMKDEIDKLKKEDAARRAAAAAAARNSGYGGGGNFPIAKYRPPSVKYTGDDPIIAAAYSQLGVPYVWGGTTPYAALDCSGLTQYCYKKAGISIPRVSGDQRNAGRPVSLANAEPGDILWMPGHVGIYIGDGNYIHAPYSGTVVQISSNMNMWTCAVRYR